MRFLKKHLFAYAVILLFILTSSVLLAKVYSTVSAFQEDMGAEPVVIIDPGHGGEDGGAVSPDGIKESVLNLEIAHRLDDVFHLIGQETLMTRTEDQSIHSGDADSIAEKKVSDLKNRVILVTRVPNPVLVSIHQNMFQEEKYSGAQVFYAPSEESRILAESMQSVLVSALNPDNRRAAKPSESVYLLEHVDCPAILVECGFLSNKEECRMLCTAEYQKQIALAMAANLTDYLRKVTTNEV